MSDQIREPQIQELVVKEIEKIGATSQANYTELQKNVKSLRDSLDAGEAKYSEKIEKLATDIVTRQEAIDNQVKSNFNETKKRIDGIELLLNKPSKHQSEKSNDEETETKIFWVHKKSANNEGVTYLNENKIDLTVDQYKEYKKAFESYIRRDINMVSEIEKKSLSVGVDPHGGYTVTPAMSNKIIEKLYETDPVRQLCSVDSITTESMEFIVDASELGGGWESETVAGAVTTSPQINKIRIGTNVSYAKIRASQQLIEDSNWNIDSWLTKKAADKLGRLEAAAFVTGDGVGKPRGFLTYASGTSFGQVQQVASGAAANLTADGFYNLKFALIEQYMSNATWLMNRTTVRDTLKLKDGDGNYLWNPSYTEEKHSVLLGLPVRMSTTMPAVAANALSVVLADWQEAYQIVDRVGISLQRDPYTQKPMVEYYFRKRVGASVINFDAIKIQIISA